MIMPRYLFESATSSCGSPSRFFLSEDELLGFAFVEYNVSLDMESRGKSATILTSLS